MNEDFVSFNLAKKLKEKGFRKPCVATYYKDGMLGYNYYQPKSIKAVSFDDCLCISDDLVLTPTISQVLKWMRDKNAIFVHISIYSKGWYCDVYTYEYYEEDREYGAKNIVQLDEFSTYEEAALAGIEYAIDNLI